MWFEWVSGGLRDTGRTPDRRMLPAGRASLNEVRQERHISSRRRILSSIGGWVENSRSSGPIRSPWIRDG
jgi:hypothetical protein